MCMCSQPEATMMPDVLRNNILYYYVQNQMCHVVACCTRTKKNEHALSFPCLALCPLRKPIH
jgi:hypothetical protein